MKKTIPLFLIVLISSCWTREDLRIDKCPPNMMDSDGNIYETIWIDEDGGNDLEKSGQCWMKENIRVGTQVTTFEEMKNDDIIQKFCFQDITRNCTKSIGGYYTRKEVMQYGEDNTKGICPEGWRVPTANDFNRLMNDYLNGTENVEAILINLFNTTNFSALLNGYKIDSGGFQSSGTRTLFWSSTTRLIGSTSTNISFFVRENPDSILANQGDKISLISVIESFKDYAGHCRCIKE